MHLFKKFIGGSFMLCFLLTCHSSFAQTSSGNINIIPKPVSLQQESGSFTISPQTTLVLGGSGLENSAHFLNLYLKKYYGFQLPVKDLSKSKSTVSASNSIVLNHKKQDYPIEGAYEMQVKPNGVTISGDAPGVFYGIQSLIQLLPVAKSQSLAIPCASIQDHPRFAYRGMMLDCGRHFFSAEFVKQFIDFIALHKMNTFHWHLTEDQGWRIEIKKYPLLTKVGAWRDSTIMGHNRDKPRKFDHQRYGGFYTQEEIKEIVKYAQERYITVIPEIEMPGHSLAAITAYPKLACQTGDYHVGNVWGVYNQILCPTPYTFKFYKNVLKEVMKLFPGHYIHIGGDEAPKVTWKNSAFCQQLMKKEGLKDENELQSYFIHTMEKFLNSKGRDIIGWDEILEGGLAPNATVMSWRGEKGGIEAAKLHHKVIMTPGTYCYLDHSQKKNTDSLTIGGYVPLEQVYNYEPIPKELSAEEGKYIEGIQANIWTEYMSWPTKVEYMIFPRLDALSEVAWSPKGEKDFDGFKQRLQEQYQRYKFRGVNYFDINTQEASIQQ